jgi:PAS domain S-box-containing protein
VTPIRVPDPEPAPRAALDSLFAPADRVAALGPTARYAVAALVAAVAVGLTVGFASRSSYTVFVPSFAAVTIAAWIGGVGPGLGAALVCVFGIDYYLIPPSYGLRPSQPADVAPLLAFVLVAALVGTLAQSLRAARDAAAVNARITAALRESQARLADAQRVGRVGNWSLDIATGAVRWSTELFRIFGREPSDTPLTAADFYAALHPDDRDRVRQVADAHRAAGRAYELEYRVVCPDGTVRVVREHAAVRRGDDGVVRDVVGTAQDVTERAVAEAAVRASEARFRALVEHTTELFTIVSAEGLVVYGSPAYLRLLGYTADEVQGHDALALVHREDLPAVRGVLDALLVEPDAVRHAEYRVRHRDGSWRVVRSVGQSLLHDPAVAGIVVNSHDVTEERRLQAVLQQAQRMEAIGQLAGGVAHDFNNLLQVIQGHARFAIEALPPDGAAHADLVALEEAAARAATLTRQLLAYSRRQLLQPRVLDLNDVVRGVEPMLRRLIGEDIAVFTQLAPALALVTADRAQLEQVLVNLAINARDAMPGGGTLTIETAEVLVAEATGAGTSDELPPAGPYVRLVVRDTGHGMDEATQARAFEPFFTTKPVGQGTGLGLSTVYGVVRQSGGWARIVSAPGAGTAVEIDLPCTRAPVRAPAPTPRPAPRGGAGTVLVVEDEVAVRRVVRRILAPHGHTVLEAADGRDALAVLAAYDGPIDLVLTDVVMPGLSGRALATQIAAERPGTAVLFMSGYTDDEIVRRDLAVPGAAVLEKPFTPDDLLAAVDAALGRSRQALAGAPAGARSAVTRD